MYFDYVIAEIHSIMRLFVHYNDVIMSAVVPQITSLTIVYSTAYSAADQRKHQSSESLAFVRGIHRWPVNSPHKGPIIWKCSHLMTSSTKTMITALYLQATWSKNYISLVHKQRVLMHGHQGWNVRHGLCHIYMIYVYIWVVYSFCLFCCLFIIVTTQFVALYKPCKPKPKFW